jgi:MFS family permease
LRSWRWVRPPPRRSGSLLPILLTPLAGRLVDRIGASVPIVTGIIAMLGGTLLLSITGGVPLGGAAALFALQAAGIAILGPTIIATVSLVVPSRVLNTAIGLTEMSFYLGAGSGTALVTAVLGAREGTERAINPLHMGAAPAYSDAFLVAVLPLLVALAFALAFAGSGRLAAAVEPSP